MTTIIPELTDAQQADLPSQAEAKVYRALRDGLPQDFVVFFQVGWILRREEEQAKDGETDFVVCHPDLGYVCIEVKGGGVGFDSSSGDWFSVDRHHQKHAINNPVNQALKAKYSIRSKLNEHQLWRDLSLSNVLRGHAVFFPDVGDASALSRPDMPSALVGCAKDLQDPKAWIDAVFAYWGNDASGLTPMGRRGIGVLREVFARSFVVAPLISAQLADQEARRLVLTKDQIRVLDFLRSHRRVAVSGGAGTGKTVLALEKARRLASEGFRTLLTCYNRQLADHLSGLCAGTPNLDVMSFHQLCHRQVERANHASGRDLVSEAKVTYPGKDLYEVQLPNALGYSLDILSDRYDAIVCDEGQDFREEFWVPLELLLTDYDSSPLYVFYDDNQNLYARAGTFPIRDESFSLTTNCRNTAPIHEAAYKHYKGVPVSPPDIQGDDVQFDESPSRDPQAAKINARIVDLVARQGVAPGDITVLVADALHKAEYYAALRRLPLPKPATWREEGVRGNSTVLIDTIQRFKGLESPIVILWGLDTIDLSQRQELLYVGMSRAKSLLVIVGRAATCAAFKDAAKKMNTRLIERFAPVLCGPRAPVVRDPGLLMDASGPVKVYYAPFEYINPGARIVLVGITPGPTQMVTANNEARRVLLAGKPNADAIQAAKGVGAFSGEPLRSNLINQLNHWGFHRWLGLGDSAELFSTARHLVQTTSLLRYPVFVNDDDYRGHRT